MQQDFRVGDWIVRPRLNRIDPVKADSGRPPRHLEPRAMELLLYFAASPRKVLSREQILADVWGGRYVAAQALNHTIWELRRALGDRARDPHYIETLTKRGYRLLAPVAPLAEPAAQPAASGGSPRTVGVTPWQDFSSSADRQRFCAAATELLTTLLAQVDALEVVLLGDRSDSQADELDCVIEGSALRTADRVRMTARLVARGGKHLWAGAYERELTDVLRTQSEVVEKIVGEIERRLASRRRPDSDEGG